MKMKKRPNGYWNDERVKKTLRTVSSELGHFPTQLELMARDFGGLIPVIQKKFGGLDSIRKDLGFSDREEKPPRYWADFENVRAVLVELENKLGHFPNQRELYCAGYSMVSSAIHKYHGGTNTVRTKLGVEGGTKSRGYWKKWENIEKEIEVVKKQLGRFPKHSEISEVNAPLKSAIIRHHGGLNSVRKKYGVKEGKKSNNHWKSWENIKNELEKIIKEVGHFPTQTELLERKLSSVCGSIQEYHGGFRAVRVKMGYIPGKYKEKGYWDNWKILEKELKEVITEMGHFPNQEELLERNQSYLIAAMYKHGGINVVKRKMNYELSRRENGALEDFDVLKKEIEELVGKNPELKGKLPSLRWLQDRGHSSILHAINRHHGGFRKFRDALGEEQTRRESGKWKDFNYASEEALRFMQEEGYEILPGTWTLAKRGYGSLVSAVTKYHGGIVSFRQKLNQSLGREESSKQLESLLEVYVGGS